MQAILVSNPNSTFTNLTSAHFTTLASWGITGIVLYTDGNGASHNFDVNTTAKFSGSPGTTRPAAGQPYSKQWTYRDIATAAHAAGIKVYGWLLAFNNHQSTGNTGFYGPLLGSMDPSYTDPNGLSWTDWNNMNADLGDALVWMGFDGVYLDNEDARVSGGSGESTWCAGYWANSFGASITVAQERAWAQTAGANMMAAINGGSSGSNGKNYPLVTYCSNSGARLGNFPGGVYSQYYAHFGNTVTIDYQGSKTLAVDVAMETYSSYLWFLKGMASGTTAPVLFGDPAFYDLRFVTTTGLPWHGASDAISWTNAIAANVAAFANLKNGTTISGFTLPSNVFISPMIWPLDQSTVTGNGRTWLAADWTSAKPAIWAGAQAGQFMLYQASWINFGTSLSMNYASNSFVSPASPATTGTATSGAAANYTPLGTPNIAPSQANGTGVGVKPTVTLTGGNITAGAVGSGAGVAPTVTVGVVAFAVAAGTGAGVTPSITGPIPSATQLTVSC